MLLLVKNQVINRLFLLGLNLAVNFRVKTAFRVKLSVFLASSGGNAFASLNGTYQPTRHKSSPQPTNFTEPYLGTISYPTTSSINPQIPNQVTFITKIKSRLRLKERSVDSLARNNLLLILPLKKR